MTVGLDGPRSASASGTTRQLVIFLHGYGADGNDLIGLAQQWADVLPDAAFVAPHAPNPCAQAPMGRQWYPIPTTGDPHSNPDILAALDGLDRFIIDECEASALSEISVALVGFSQGAKMAMEAGLQRNCAFRPDQLHAGIEVLPHLGYYFLGTFGKESLGIVDVAH